MRVALLTREYPPEVYGGAGVHVEYLARELERLEELTVHCWGADARAGRRRRAPRLGRAGRQRAAPRRAAGDVDRPDDGRRRRGRRARPQPHLVREPRRPPRQARARHPARRHRPLARAAAAVEGRAARRRLRAVVVLRADRAGGRRRGDRRLGGDAARHPRRLPGDRARARRGDLQRHRRRASTRPIPAPTCSSATASTPIARRSCSSAASRARRACPTCSTPRSSSTRPPSSCCAPARPTRRRSAPRSSAASSGCASERGNVIWIDEMLPKPDVIQLLSHATVFACPSIYEPLGIVNLEAMACEAAVVATATGGIVEVVAGRRHRPARAVRARAGSDRAARPGGVRRTRSPSASTRCSPIRRVPRRWARRAARGPSRRSTGPRSPRRRRPSTAGSDPVPRRRSARLAGMLRRRTKIVATLGPATDAPGRAGPAGGGRARLRAAELLARHARRPAPARGRRARRGRGRRPPARPAVRRAGPEAAAGRRHRRAARCDPATASRSAARSGRRWATGCRSTSSTSPRS